MWVPYTVLRYIILTCWLHWCPLITDVAQECWHQVQTLLQRSFSSWSDPQVKMIMNAQHWMYWLLFINMTWCIKCIICHKQILLEYFNSQSQYGLSTKFIHECHFFCWVHQHTCPCISKTPTGNIYLFCPGQTYGWEKLRHVLLLYCWIMYVSGSFIWVQYGLTWKPLPQ